MKNAAYNQIWTNLFRLTYITYIYLINDMHLKIEIFYFFISFIYQIDE